jgi:uncharacterized protein YqfB (UPF0267 family)
MLRKWRTLVYQCNIKLKSGFKMHIPYLKATHANNYNIKFSDTLKNIIKAFEGETYFQPHLQR